MTALTQKVTVPTSYFKNVGRIYPNAIIDSIDQYYILGEGWTLEPMDCTKNNLEALKQKGVTAVNLKITRAKIQNSLFPEMDSTPKNDFHADFKLSELL